MKNRVRLGAAAAVALGALLLATVLASPALAWHSNVTAEAKCLDSGKIGVHYTVTSWEKGHEATVYVFYKLDSGEGGKLPTGHFGQGEDESSFEGDFELAGDTTGTVTVFAVAKWKDDQNPSKDHSQPVQLPDKCKGHESSTSSSESSTSTSESTTSTSESTTSTSESTTSTSESTTTTTTPSTTESSVAPTTSIEETTTTAAVGAATSTTAGGGQLPFTGASSGPMLLAGIVLLGGGTLVLLLTRAKGGHATK
jgi:hypothetical protein